MSRHTYFLCISFLAASASVTLACGSASHQLQSISVSPATAMANGAPVQFTATGTYSTAPSTVTPLQANWGAVSELNGIPTGLTNDVSITSNGVAQCMAGASGVYSIGAWDLMDPTIKVSCSSTSIYGSPGCNAVLGTAQLTCP